MKRIFFLAALISLGSTFVCCKNKKHMTASATNSTTSETTNSTQDKVLSYRLVVSFISKGAGTDSDKRPKFIKFVEDHPKKPKYTVKAWGREGEADYYFTLSELSSKEQIDFVNDVKSLIAKSDLVIIKENVEIEQSK